MQHTVCCRYCQLLCDIKERVTAVENISELVALHTQTALMTHSPREREVGGTIKHELGKEAVIGNDKATGISCCCSECHEHLPSAAVFINFAGTKRLPCIYTARQLQHMALPSFKTELFHSTTFY
jgi:hypothetical protein